ncbi:DegT/DnrJ/EryC1/StrS family aminotransferase [Luteirhabdus pelagi]|uniref:DegT/DnrJ/EryC1/StrS family aminotransferase n=1 Tax=Luteirhabdus pelagi TaxID=2792783 RepID=UPI001939BA1B|nr:DegT/DnrJ/EryC1/StrS family aminotransferase [Luteirhabdus pelagi]
MINVTKTFLPPQEEYQKIMARVWDTGWITNRGVLVQELEQTLQDYLKVPNIIAMANGTLPIQIALKAFGCSGEIITTPFSYVATTSSIVWEGCTPVFVDIHPEYLTIDETKIEAAITKRTTAILATHVYGNPCAVEEIEKIATRYNIKVIYDAAHCFGVTYKDRSIFEFGDASTCSFHATKIFHSGEGGALFTKPENFENFYFHHNFGHDGPEIFRGLGINAKMSELHAAMGLAVIRYIDTIIENRRRAVMFYRDHIMVKPLQIRSHTDWNYSYYPIIFDSERQLLACVKKLNEQDIFPRRYFYPSLDTLPYTKEANVPISHDISAKVLCLPLSHDISEEELEKISNLINAAVH